MQNQLIKLNGGACFVVRKGGLWKFMGGDEGGKLLRGKWESADSRGGMETHTQSPLERFEEDRLGPLSIV